MNSRLVGMFLSKKIIVCAHCRTCNGDEDDVRAMKSVSVILFSYNIQSVTEKGSS